MGRMVRKQVYIAPEQDALLKRRAAELGVTESELIRRGINYAVLDVPPPVPRRLDDEAWREAIAFLEERERTLPATDGKPLWSREETYDWRWNRSRGQLSD